MTFNAPPQKVLRGSSHRFPYFAWLMALVWSAVAAGLVYADLLPASGIPPWVAWAAIGALCIPGPLFVWHSVMATLRFFRYRSIELLLHPSFGQPGGTVSGVVEVPVEFDTKNVFTVEMTAVEYRRVNRKVVQHVLVHEIVEARAARGLRGTRLGFALRIPADAPPSLGYGEVLSWTPATRDKVYLRWTIAVSGDVAGVDLAEEFEFPVHRATAAEAAPSDEILSKPLPYATVPRKLCYESVEQGGRLVIWQAPWKKPNDSYQQVLVSIAFGGIFFLLGVGMIYGVAGGGISLALFSVIPVGAIFILIGLLLSVGDIVTSANELRAEISRDGAVITRTLWGIRLKQVRLDLTRIAAVEILVETAPGGGPPNRTVIVRELTGADHCLAEWIPSVGEAEALRSRVVARLGRTENAEAGAAASAAAEGRKRFDGRVFRNIAFAYVAASAIVFFAHQLHPAWFSFSNPESVPQSVTATSPAEPSHTDEVNDVISASYKKEGRGDLKGAIGELDRGAISVRERNGPDHPLEAYLLNLRARVEQRARDDGAAERSLVEAARILEGYKPKEALRLLGNRGGELDLERQAFGVGEFFWDRMRYADAHVYFVKAREVALVLDVDERERNFRRAQSSARVMATACALAKWELADEAMADLKERFPRVEKSAQAGLKYWIDTGEPRLKARKC